MTKQEHALSHMKQKAQLCYVQYEAGEAEPQHVPGVELGGRVWDLILSFYPFSVASEDGSDPDCKVCIAMAFIPWAILPALICSFLCLSSL